MITTVNYIKYMRIISINLDSRLFQHGNYDTRQDRARSKFISHATYMLNITRVRERCTRDRT